MDFQTIKENIILKEGVKYFDCAASGLAYRPIEAEIERVLATYANVHSAGGESAEITSDYYENARAKIKELLGCEERYYLISCGFGATAAIMGWWALRRLRRSYAGGHGQAWLGVIVGSATTVMWLWIWWLAS